MAFNKTKNKYGVFSFVQGVLKGGPKGKETAYSIEDALHAGSRCCSCHSMDCCNGVYAKLDIETQEWLGCFIRGGVEECHECSEAHRLANEAKAAFEGGK